MKSSGLHITHKPYHPEAPISATYIVWGIGFALQLASLGFRVWGLGLPSSNFLSFWGLGFLLKADCADKEHLLFLTGSDRTC